MKVTQLNTTCNKRAGSSLWLPSEQPAREMQPKRPDMSSSSMLALPAATWLGEVNILVLCSVGWAQVHLKMRKNAEGHKAISEMKARGWWWWWGNHDAEGHRLQQETDWMEREEESTTWRLPWITTEIGCGSNSSRAASSCLAGSASGLTCTQVHARLSSSSWSEGGVVAVAWFQVQG